MKHFVSGVRKLNIMYFDSFPNKVQKCPKSKKTGITIFAGTFGTHRHTHESSSDV